MAKRQKKVEEGGPGFLTTYADIVTLLMAFFVLLFAISAVDEQKFLSLLKGLEEDFGNNSYATLVLEGSPSLLGANQPSGSIIPVSGGAISIVPIASAVELQQIADAVQLTNGLPTTVVGGTPDPSDVPSTEIPSGSVLDLTGLKAIEKRLVEAADALGLRDAVSTEFRERGLVVVLSTDDLFFRSGSAVLEEGLGKNLIGAFAEVIGDFDNPVFVEGHTDDVPLNRTGYDNWNLSADRAAAVVKEFERTYGVAGARLSSIGRSYFHPLAPNDSDENRAHNRRVELVIGLRAEDFTAIGEASEGEPAT